MQPTATPPRSTVCGFCSTGHHTRCPRTLGGNGYRVTLCPCTDAQHTPMEVCKLCKRPGDSRSIDFTTRTCLDWEACAGRQRQPFAKAPVATPPAPRLAAGKHAVPHPRSGRVPRDCKCGCEGKTKGGNFLPGHDKRYITALVKKIPDARSGWAQEAYAHLVSFSPKLAQKFAQEAKILPQPRAEDG